MFMRVWTGSGMSSQVTQFQNPEFVKWNIDISDVLKHNYRFHNVEHY